MAEESVAERIVVESERLGVVEADPERVLQMTSPIFGFGGSRRYAVLSPPGQEGSAFAWLQSLDEPKLAFVVVNPFEFFPDYDFELPTPDQRELGIESPEECAVLALVTVPHSEPSALTANLVAPLVVNARTKAARQIVLYESGYHTRHPLLGDEPSG